MIKQIEIFVVLFTGYRRVGPHIWLRTYNNFILMFGIFKKKTARQKLQKKYELLLKEGYDLSTSDRTKSYLKIAEAQEVLAEIEELAKVEKDG